jgi:hypothetical protein
MNIVSNSSAIRRGIIIAKHSYFFSFTGALTIPFVDRIIKKNELDIKQVTKLLKMFDKKLSSEMSYGSI